MLCIEPRNCWYYDVFLLNRVGMSPGINFGLVVHSTTLGIFHNLHKNKMAAKNRGFVEVVFEIRMLISYISKHMFLRMLSTFLGLKVTFFEILTHFYINPRWQLIKLYIKIYILNKKLKQESRNCR